MRVKKDALTLNGTKNAKTKIKRDKSGPTCINQCKERS